MSAHSYRIEDASAVITYPNWGAIWAGVFTFFAIWSVFGLLGMSIFASITNRPASSVDVGMGIWAVILTIIAMFVAGRTTGHLAAINSSRDGVMHGMVMFGLSVVAAIIFAALSGYGANVASAATNMFGGHAYLLTLSSGLGWFGFISLFLGWLAAMAGASMVTHNLHAPMPQPNTHAV
jgi:hypothetical protein